MAESPYSISAVLSVGYANASVAVWSSGTALNAVASLVANDYSYNTLNVSLAQTSTITGGQVTFQGSYDGTNWFNMQGFTPGSFAAVGPTYNLQASTYAVFQFNLTGVPYFQVLLSSVLVGSGTVTIGYAADSFVNTMAAAQAGAWTVGISGTVGVTQSTSPWVVSGTVAATQSGTWTVQQGTPPWTVSQSGAWDVNQTIGVAGFGKITDGTNTAAVKAASSPAVAADPALVVTMSPNTVSVPVTQAPASTTNTVAATWTSATALNTTVALISANLTYDALVVTLSTAAGITGGQLTFEVSNDNTNWLPITGISASQFGTFAEQGVYYLVGGQYVAGFFNTTSWQYFRVRLSTVITGSGNLVIGYAAQAAGQPPTVVRQPHNFGRTFVCITISDIAIGGTLALVAFTLNQGGTQTTGNTHYMVPLGKTLRLQSIDCTLRSTSGTQPVQSFILSAASVGTSSPILWATLQSASTSTYDHVSQEYPDGLEIMSGQQLAIASVNVNGNTTGRLTLTLVGYEY